jgi:signal peptidase I
MDPKISVGTLREVWQQSDELHWLPVRGSSMLPLLRDGDRILVSHQLSGVQRGDILVFQQVDGLVAHRVVSITRGPGNRRVYRTKGDNCTTFDAPLSAAEALGLVDVISRDGKEYDLTTIGWRLRNSLLATFHLLVGTLFQVFRNIKYQFQK